MEYRVVVNIKGTFWYKPGTDILHREDGPAIEYVDGDNFWYKFWYKDGKFHREDGPAFEHVDGDKLWYLDGVKMTEEEFLAKTQPAKELTVADLENLLGYKIKVVK